MNATSTETVPSMAMSFPTARLLAFLGGSLLILGAFLPWYTATGWNGAHVLNAFQLGPFVPEALILPALGIGLIFGAILQAGPARFPATSRFPSTAAVVLGLVAVVIGFEAAWRFSPTALSLFGASFWGAASVGWYITVLGGFLAIGSGATAWFHKWNA
jgi:hypothetical protein